MKLDNITLTLFPLDVESVKKMFLSALGTEFCARHHEDRNEILSDYYTQQYCASQVKFILFSPKSNPHTTIMIANIMDGYANLVKYVSRLCNIEYYTICLSNGSNRMMQAYHFHHYTQSSERHILCYQDPKWVFYEEGQPLWFENITHYKQRLRRNRLNRDIISEYLRCLGWEIDREDFWRSTKGYYEFSKE